MSVEVASLLVKIGADTREAEQAFQRVKSAAQGLTGAGGLAGGVFDLIKGGASLALGPVGLLGGAVNLLGGAFNLLTSPVRLVTDFVGSLAGQFMIGTLAAKGLEEALSFLGEATIGFNATLEQAQMKWQTFLGSAEDAEAWMYRMQRFAALTPFDYEGVERGYSLLRAYGFALQELEPWLRRLGNASAAVGQGGQGIERLALSIGQIRAAGRLQGAEARELALMGVPVWEMLGAHLGKSPGAVRAMSEAGQISAQTFEAAFTQWIEGKGDLMGSLNKTLRGSLSTIKDSVFFGASTALKPFFDLLSEGAQSLAQWLQTDEFTQWAARVQAAASMAVEGIRVLAPVVAGVVSDVLGLLWDLAQGAVEAFSYLDPFATHSPSLVQRVDEGVKAILDKYGLLSEVAIPFKAGSDEFKRELADQRREVDIYKDALDRAKDTLDRWTRTPIQGEGAADDRLFRLRQQINRAQLRETELQLSNAPKSALDRASKDVERLNLQYRKLELETNLRFDPQRRAIDKAASDKPGEQPASAILAGIREAKTELAKLTPVYESHTKVLDAMDTAQKAAAASAKALAGGAGAGGIKVPDDKSFLGWDKQKLEDFKQQVEGLKEQFGGIRDFFVDAANASERLRAALGEIHEHGLVGGISQLLYPTEYGLTEAEQTENERKLMRGQAPRYKPHFLAPPRFDEWKELLDQMWADFSKALDATWETVEPTVKKAGEKVGRAIVQGMVEAVKGIDWQVLLGLKAPPWQTDAEWRQGLRDTSGVWGEPGQPGLMPPPSEPDARQQALADQLARRRGAGGVAANAPGWFKWLFDPDTFVQSLFGKPEETKEQAKPIGESISLGILNGLEGKQTELAQGTEQLIDQGVIGPAEAKLAAHSPSLVAKGWGEDIAAGLVLGLETRTQRTATEVERWLQTAVLDPLAKGANKAYTIGQSIAQGVQDGTTGVTPAQRRRDAYERRRIDGAALGDWVSAGDSRVVGEKGPEVFTPGTSGYVHPNGSGSGGEVKFEIHIGQIVANTTDEAYQKGQAFGQGLRDAWRQVTSQGGHMPLGLQRSA